jgi:hypothetical protein
MSSKERVAQARALFEEWECPKETVQYEKEGCSYFVIDCDHGDLPRGLPLPFAYQCVDIAGLVAGTPIEECAVFGVSSYIDPAFHPFVAAHQVIEHALLPVRIAASKEPMTQHPCREAGEREWELVLQKLPTGRRKEYATQRLLLFRALQSFIADGPSAIPPLSNEHFLPADCTEQGGTAKGLTQAIAFWLACRGEA